jgi:hypothetical protein
MPSKSPVETLPPPLFAIYVLVILLIWLLPIFLGVRAAKAKGRSPHWMWFGLHPITGWIAFLWLRYAATPAGRLRAGGRTAAGPAEATGIEFLSSVPSRDGCGASVPSMLIGRGDMEQLLFAKRLMDNAQLVNETGLRNLLQIIETGSEEVVHGTSYAPGTLAAWERVVAARADLFTDAVMQELEDRAKSGRGYSQQAAQHALEFLKRPRGPADRVAKGKPEMLIYCWSGPSPSRSVENQVAQQLLNHLSHEHRISPSALEFHECTGHSQDERTDYFIAAAVLRGVSKDRLRNALTWHVDTPSGPASYFLILAS